MKGTWSEVGEIGRDHLWICHGDGSACPDGCDAFADPERLMIYRDPHSVRVVEPETMRTWYRPCADRSEQRDVIESLNRVGYQAEPANA